MRTTMYHLLVYSHTFDKLYTELRSANCSRPFPTYAEVRNLPYLDACVQEGVRMHPPFALPFERVVPQGGITLLGHFLPEGTKIGGSPYVVNRHKGWFGDDAEFWRPERWIEGDEAHKRKLEQGMLTVSCGWPLGPLLADPTHLVWRWSPDLSWSIRRHNGNQEGSRIPYPQL